MSNLTSSIKQTNHDADFKIDEVANRQAIEKITLARVAMVMKAPFFGSLAIRLRLVNADKWLPTAATDGRRLYYNSKFVNELSVKEVVFLLAHEVLHVAYMHAGIPEISRLQGRDPKIFNIAADYKVNQDIVDCEIGSMIKSALISPQFKDMTTEEVYDYLMQNADKINMDELAERILDEHLEDSGGGEEQESQDGDHSVSTGPVRVSPEEREKLKDEIKEAVINAAKSAAAGKIPGGIKKLINDIVDPVMPWEELLQQNMLSTIKNDFSWMRVNRKGWHMPAVLPGMNYEEQIDIAVSLDSSGSCYNDANKFFSELYAIASMHPNAFRITVWTFDTKCYNKAVFTENNMDELLEYEVHGGGGTHIEANWDFMKEEGIDPKLLVVFTDGYNDNDAVWGDPNYCDTLWVLFDNPNRVPPFGMHAYYNS